MTDAIRRGYCVLNRVEGGYAGVIRVSGFPYSFHVVREGDGIAVTITDTPPDPVDDAANEAAHQEFLDRLTQKVSG